MSDELDIPVERAPTTFTPSQGTLSKIRAASAALLGSGATTLAYGLYTVGISHWFVSILVPVFLGAVGGAFFSFTASAIKSRPDGQLDAAEWIQMGVSWLIISIMIARGVVPRLQPGVGFVMTGAALATIAYVLYEEFLSPNLANSLQTPEN